MYVAMPGWHGAVRIGYTSGLLLQANPKYLHLCEQCRGAMDGGSGIVQIGLLSF